MFPQFRLRPILSNNRILTGHRLFLRSNYTSAPVHSVQHQQKQQQQHHQHQHPHHHQRTHQPRFSPLHGPEHSSNRQPRILIKPTIPLPMPPSRTTNAAQAATLDMISVTFLGTASAQPSSTRNHSSLALSLGGRGDIWLFDCGEATQQRIQRSTLKMGKIRKIFITHTHGELLSWIWLFGITDSMWIRGSYIWSCPFNGWVYEWCWWDGGWCCRPEECDSKP